MTEKEFRPGWADEYGLELAGMANPDQPTLGRKRHRYTPPSKEKLAERRALRSRQGIAGKIIKGVP